MSIGGVGSGVSAYMRPFQPSSFSTLDSNSSGDITLDELKSSAADGAADTKSSEQAEQLFSAMDADGNGSVTSEEKDAFDAKLQEQWQAMQFMVQQMGGASPPSNEDIFTATDADSSGGISLEEFSSSDAAEGVSTDELAELFSTIDDDGDGSITQTETSDFLDSLKTAMSNGPMGPPPGGPPPGSEASSEESEEEETTLAVDLLTAARSAYSAQATSNDLFETLSKIFDQAA